MSRRFVRKAEQTEPAERRQAGGGLSEEELAGEVGEELPDRAALSVLDADVAIPVNAAMAADVLSGLGEGDDDAEPGSEDDEDSSQAGRPGSPD